VRALVLLLLALAAAAPAPAGVRPGPDGLADALAARALLGPDRWARVVRIDNSGPGGPGPRSVYPKTVYALVFELSGLLWFYCDADGTQSLSLRRGALEADEADPGPLFRAISPRFRGWSWVELPPRWPVPALGPPNACFIDCVAALRRRALAGAESSSPRLLFYYIDTPAGPLGHTVLLLGEGASQEALDPARSPSPVRLPAPLEGDPRLISRYLRGGEVASARVLRIETPASPGGGARWASLPAGRIPAG
jgi:hypothetical protein